MIKEYIVEMIKVNGSIAAAITAVNIQDLLNWNEVVQAILTTVAVFLAVLYSLYKTIHMIRLSRWAKEDRLEDIEQDMGVDKKPNKR